MRRAVFVILPILLFAFATPALAKGHHVPGEFPTIQAAVDAAEEGDRVIIHKGPYAENVVIADKVDVQILGRKRPDIEPPAGAPAFTFINCRKVKVKGVNIVNAGTHAIVLRDCDDGRVKNVRIKGREGGSAGDGVRIEGGRTYRVRKCTIQDVAGSAVHATDGGSGPARRVEVWKNKIRRIGQHGVFIAGEAYHEVRKNEFEECGWAVALGPDTFESRASENRISDCTLGALDIAGTSNLCRKNRVRRVQGDGILVSGTDCWVRMNRLKKVEGDGIRVSGEANLIKGNKTNEVGGDGRVIEGVGHYVHREKGKKAEGRGIVLFASDSEIRGCEAGGSGSDGFVVDAAAAGNLIWNNSTSNSAGDGLVDGSPEGANEYKSNSFR
ncbi:MAG: right-handed parallel beta-helix repeat-containing protein [Planctomycetota bacterium]